MVRVDPEHLLDLLGNTPVARVDTPLPHRHGGFWAKLECLSAGGMKARSAVAMLVAARERGELRPPGERDDATTATSALAAAQGAWCVRVHDVRASADAVRVAARWTGGAR